jgi:micrococcal nuclease
MRKSVVIGVGALAATIAGTGVYGGIQFQTWWSQREAVSTNHVLTLAPKASKSVQERLSRIDIPKAFAKGNSSKVLKSVDGDTINIEVQGEQVGVRLKGIDTPETKARQSAVHCYGPEASTYTAGKVPPGTWVTLVSDFSKGEVDEYGRLVAHIQLRDGTYLNEHILVNGYARVSLFKNVRHMNAERYQSAENDAFSHGRGMWASRSSGGCSYQPGVSFTKQQ